jgi:hypothetical protein
MEAIGSPSVFQDTAECVDVTTSQVTSTPFLAQGLAGTLGWTWLAVIIWGLHSRPVLSTAATVGHVAEFYMKERSEK